MRRWRVMGVLMIVLSVLTTGAVAAQWESSDRHYDVSQQAIVIEDPPCTGYRMKIIVNESEYSACVFDGSALRFAVYFDTRDRLKTAIAVGKNQSFFELKDICTTVRLCFYLPQYDRLVTGVSLPGGGVRLAMFENLSRQLVASGVGNNKTYQFSGQSESVFPLLNSAERVMSGAISANQRWGVFEIRNKGLVVVDFDSLSVRRISAPGFLYGVGNDPTLYLAISNGGKHVLLTGQNAGPLLYVIDDTCGDGLGVSLTQNFASGSVACRTISFSLSTYMPAIFRTGIPSISSDGSLVSFAVETKDGKKWHVGVSSDAQLAGSRLSLLGLGDSFSSGEGELDDSWYLPHTNTPPDTCHTSLRSYPYKIAQFFSLPLGAVRTVACSGATTHDILGNSDYAGQKQRLASMTSQQQSTARQEAKEQFIPGRLPQLDFVQLLQPQIVTVGIGGNDAGFVKKLVACAMPATCDWAQPGEKRAQVLTELQALHPRFVQVYQQIAKASPLSRVYAVGYPSIIEVDGACGMLTGLLFNREEREFMVEATVYLNQVMQAAARTAGVAYVDATHALNGEVLCSSNPTAVNAFRFGDDVALFGLPLLKVIGTESFHPTPMGHVRMAQAITEQFPDMVTGQQCRPGQTVCAVSTPVPAPSSYWLSGVESQVRLQSETIAEVSDNDIAVTIPAGYFAASGTVSIEIHSEPHSFGQFTVGSFGEVTVTLPLPEGIEDGYHTVYVTGQSELDETVTLYDIAVVGSRHVPEQEDAELESEPSAYSKPPHIASTVPSLLGLSLVTPRVVANTAQNTAAMQQQPTTTSEDGQAQDSDEPLQPAEVLGVNTEGIIQKALLGTGALIATIFLALLLMRRRL